MSFNFIFWGMPPSNRSQKVCQLSGFSLKTGGSSFGHLRIQFRISIAHASCLSVSLSPSLSALSLSPSLSAISMKVHRKFLLNLKQYRFSLERNLQSCLAPVNIYFNIYYTYNFSDKWVKLFLHRSNLASGRLFSSNSFSRINHDRYKFSSEHFAYVFFPLINSTSPFNRLKNKSWKSVDASQQTQN